MDVNQESIHTISPGTVSAWQYIDFLQRALQGLKTRIRKSKAWKSKGDIRMVDILFVLIPKSCQTPGELTERDLRINIAEKLPDYKVSVAGRKDRTYTDFTIYTFETDEEKTYGLPLEYATPLQTLYDMSLEDEVKAAGMDENSLAEESWNFYVALEKLIRKSKLEDKVQLIHYTDYEDGMFHGIADMLAERIDRILDGTAATSGKERNEEVCPGEQSATECAGTSKNLPVGFICAWQYITGYLRFVLPNVGANIHTCKLCHSLWADKSKLRIVDKLFVLIPENCRTPGTLTENDSRITHVENLPDFDGVNRAGNVRKYTGSSVYKFELNENVYGAAVEYARPLHTLRTMSEVKEILPGLKPLILKEQVKIFHETLLSAMSHAPDMARYIELIYIPDKNVKLIAETLAMKIDQEKGTVYPMSSKPGRTVIINNVNFFTLPCREGSKEDVKVLKKFFKSAGFEVIVEDDLTIEKMKEFIEEERKNPAHLNASAFVFVILSHGYSGNVYALDGCSDDKNVYNYLSIKTDIIDKFDGKNCQALIGKPKLFFIQACQGREETQGCKTGAMVDGSQEVQPDDQCSDGNHNSFKSRCVIDDVSLNIHEKADVLLFMSTVEDYISWRSPVKGSRFIQTLMKEFNECAQTEDVLAICAKVADNINQGSKKQVQLPMAHTTLRKKVKFNITIG